MEIVSELRFCGEEYKMPSKKVIYECKYCGKEFADFDECKEHEESHIYNYENASTEEIIDALKQLGESAYGYHIGEMTMGLPVKNFENLMKEAAKRLDFNERK